MDSIAEHLVKDIETVKALAVGEAALREGDGDTEESARAYLEQYRIP